MTETIPEDVRKLVEEIGTPMGWTESEVEAAEQAILADRASRPAAVPRVSIPDRLIEDYVEGYDFRGDGDYTPTEAERVMLIDFGHGLLGEIETLAAPAALAKHEYLTQENAINGGRTNRYDRRHHRDGE